MSPNRTTLWFMLGRESKAAIDGSGNSRFSGLFCHQGRQELLFRLECIHCCELLRTGPVGDTLLSIERNYVPD